MIEIDGLLWFLGALVICGLHVLNLRGWRREQQHNKAWWKHYDAKAQRSHDEIMGALDRTDVHDLGWNLDGNCERGQA